MRAGGAGINGPGAAQNTHERVRRQRNLSNNWSNHQHDIIRVAAWASIACLLIAIVFQARGAAITVPTFHLDGAFQTASGLFRLDAGQAPGRDFFPYLGIGPLLLLFPAFKLAGASLAASVLAAKLVTLTLGWVAISALCLLIFRPQRAVFAFAAGAAVFMASNYLQGLLFDVPVFTFAVEPGNSLRPVRVAAPYLAALGACFLLRQVDHGWRRNMAAGALTGLALLWSNDFAIPTAALFGLFHIATLYHTQRPVWKRSALTLGVAALASGALLLTLVTAGHPLALIHYNFVDVATDQWWYFAPYGADTRIFSWDQWCRLISPENHFPLVVLLSSAAVVLKTRKQEHALLALIGLTLFSGGALASGGGHLGGYFGGFYYWGAVTALLACLRALHLVSRKRLALNARRAGGLALGTIVLVLFMLLALASAKRSDFLDALHAAQQDKRRFFVPELGGYLDIGWQAYIDYARKNRARTVIEEYWGIWNALNRKLTPWPVDSVIHALGAVRHAAQSSLADAELMVSTRHATSPQWQPWSVSQNFWFYESLFSGWTPDFVSPTTIVWRKTSVPSAATPVGCQVASSGHSVALAPGSEGLFKISLTYAASGAGRFLIMMRNNISYADDADGHVSLPPGQSAATFPALITRKSGLVLGAKRVGGAPGRFTITSCSAWKIAFPHPEVFPVQP
jgi:NADH:ubiquinone oxidoreductase subunit 6 (subunit J)